MFPRLPPVTKALLIANGVAFLLQLIVTRTDVPGAPTFRTLADRVGT